jgi:hypothetical protein
MTKQLGRIALAALAVVLLCASAPFGQEKMQPEHYAATWAVVGGAAGGSSVSLDIRINKFDTDEDVMKFAALLKEKGQDALRRALEQEDVGQISPTGRVGTPIAIARKLKSGNKTIVRVITARNLPFLELRYNGRSTDYPFTIIQLDLNEQGKGTGTGIAAASIRFNKKADTLEIESFQQGTSVNKLLNVYLMK